MFFPANLWAWYGKRKTNKTKLENTKPNWCKLTQKKQTKLLQQKLNLIQPNKTCTHNKTYNNTKLTQRTKPGLIAFYDIQPKNGMA